MAQTTNYVTTGVIRDKNAIDVENQKKEQAVRAHAEVKAQYDQALGAIGDIPLGDDEKIDYDAKSKGAPKPSVVNETGPDETARSPEELKNHPEDNPTQTLDAKNAPLKRIKERQEKEGAAADDGSESVNELNKQIAEEQEADRLGKHKSHKKHSDK